MMYNTYTQPHMYARTCSMLDWEFTEPRFAKSTEWCKVIAVYVEAED